MFCFNVLIKCMKILHLADLHIGKKLNGLSMSDSQKYVLKQAIDLVFKQNIQSVLIAGDIFDKPIPSVEALNLFSWFLQELAKFKVKIYIVTGNHDSIERLSFLSSFLKKSNIFIASEFSGQIESFSLNCDVEIFLLPYIIPYSVKKFFPNEKIQNTNDAFNLIIKNCKLNKDKINILLCHQFVFAKNSKLILNENEIKSVGLTDGIDYKIFKKFDYCALGHLHCAQKVASDTIRYSGSVLKYSFSEIHHKKVFNVINIEDKNNIKTEFYPILPLFEMKEYKGYIDEFLSEEFYSKINKNDYIKFVLLDEYVLDAKKKLSFIYPNIVMIEFENVFNKQNSFEFRTDFDKQKSMFEHFLDFFEIQTNIKPDSSKEKIIKEIVKLVKEDSKCDL